MAQLVFLNKLAGHNEPNQLSILTLVQLGFHIKHPALEQQYGTSFSLV